MDWAQIVLSTFLFHYSFEMHQNMSWQCEDILLSPHCSKIISIPHALYGRCLKFNEDQEAVARYTGDLEGEHFLLYMAEEEYFGALGFGTTTSGFRVAISEPELDVRMVQDGYDYGTSQRIDVGLRKEVINRTTRHPWSKCIITYPEEYQEVQQKYQQSSYYTETNCERICLMSDKIHNDKCFPYKMEEWKSLKKTDSQKLAPCSKGIEKATLQRCKEQCKPACGKVTWRKDHIFQPIPPVLEYEKYAEWKKEKNLTKFSLTWLNVFYTDMLLMKTFEEPAKLPEDILAEIGGHFGLWWGMSILTFFEFYVIACNYLKKKLYKKKQEKKEACGTV